MLTLPSFAKINWTLEVLGKRPDGYHELRTLLQTISVADELDFELIEQGVELRCTHPQLPLDETNLVYRAAQLMREATGCDKGVRVTLRKHLPLAAGLGGGSSNAAVTILALQRLWEVQLETRQLFQLGARLGADVPFFFLGGTCIGVGRGDEVYPTAEIAAEHLLLVNAGIAVPTRDVYGDLPAELTNPGAITKMPISLSTAYQAMGGLHQRTGEFLSVFQPVSQTALQNDLELPVLLRHPVLQTIKQQLQRSGARGVLMSGSGSTIFAFFDSEATRSVAQQDLQSLAQAKDWWCAAARTLSRTFYRQALQLS